MDQRLPETAVTDWRGLCLRMADELDHLQELLESDIREVEPHPLAVKARAALAAEAVAVRATDDELWDIGERHLWTGTDESVTNYRILTSFIEAARAVLTRFSHQPAPPAEGEVGELVQFLRDWGDDYADEGTEWHRAADLPLPQGEVEA